MEGSFLWDDRPGGRLRAGGGWGGYYVHHPLQYVEALTSVAMCGLRSGKLYVALFSFKKGIQQLELQDHNYFKCG